MVFYGPASWAQPREEAWERDTPRGLAEQDHPDELLELADRATEKHPAPVRPVQIVQLGEAA